MQTISVADAKAHLSEVLSRVEAGEELRITRRGRAIARLIPEPADATHQPFDFDVLKTFVDAQPLSAGNSVVDMRAEDRY